MIGNGFYNINGVLINPQHVITITPKETAPPDKWDYVRLEPDGFDNEHDSTKQLAARWDRYERAKTTYKTKLATFRPTTKYEVLLTDGSYITADTLEQGEEL